MNIQAAEYPVQWLFLDLNAFFASCEQQENPALRGKPVMGSPQKTDGGHLSAATARLIAPIKPAV